MPALRQPARGGDTARKAFEKISKAALPASHRELGRAIEREAREYRARIAALDQHAHAAAMAADDVGEEPDAEPVDGDDEVEDLEERQAA